MEYLTVKDIEIAKVGTHATGDGEVPITAEDLQNMVLAAGTGLLPKPVVKIGHINAAVDNPSWGDGAPAYGQLDNLRLSDDGQTLVADWVNAPKDLADKQPSAYPQRSMEATLGMELKDETGTVVESYPAVLTGVALLGATAPAVKGLADVHASFSTRGGAKVFASGGTSVAIRASLPGGRTGNELQEALREAVHSLEDRGSDEWLWLVDFTDEHAFYQEEAPEGRTFQRAYTLDSDGKVAWSSDPVEVIPRHTFEPVTEPSTSQVPVPQQAVAASQSSATDSAKPVEAPELEGDKPMLSKETLAALRKQLELPEDASVEDITAAINGDNQPAEEDPTGADQPGGDTTDDQAAAEDAQDREPELVAASAGAPATVTLSEARFNDFLKEHADMKVKLSAIEQERQESFIDSEISRAKAEGRILPADEEQVRVLFSEAPKAAKKYLDGLTAVLPVREMGTTNAVNASGDSEVEQLKTAARQKLLGIDTESEAA